MNNNIIYTGNSSPSTNIMLLLSSFVDLLVKKGLPYKIAFVLVFSIASLLILTYLKIKLTKIYGNVRAVKLFIYGFGFALIFIYILVFFTDR